MSDIAEILQQIELLLQAVRPGDAENRLRSLLDTMGREELRVWEPDFRATIEKFLPKRRRNLNDLVDQLLTTSPLQVKDKAPTDSDAKVMPLLDDLDSRLRELSDHHIFQWSTFYRDSLAEFFTDFIALSNATLLPDASQYVKELFARHTCDTFLKGYNYVTRHDTQDHALVKSVSGLQKFLDLPIEFYSTRLSSDLKLPEATALRLLTSSMLSGIIKGYASLTFPSATGSKILSDNTKSWAYTLAFITKDDLTELLPVLGAGDLQHGIRMSIVPLSWTIDILTQNGVSYSPLPALSQFVWTQRRLDVWLRPPPYTPDRRPVAIQCYLDPDLVAEDLLLEASTRDVAAIVAPLRPDLREILIRDRLQKIVVPVMEDAADGSSTAEQLRKVLENAIYRLRSPRLADQPLAYNFAREFPLTNPFLTRYFHVYRMSVRDLMRTFERRNGVRLWCSVRRSGKTTAGLDLGTTTGDSNVVSQTCDTTGQIPDGNILYDAVARALSNGDQLPNDFFARTVTNCLLSGQSPDHRTVLVLDEYETLFGHLASAVTYDLRLRYTVVQPLLNQMVTFTGENLLVLLGQQPTAHYILMDQNQLSAYVQQDAFPLFSHGDRPDEREFAELLQKILSNRVQFDKSFADRVFVETAGHPYLTVNMMVEFVDWLIRNKRSVVSLSLTSADVASFASRMFRRDNISLSHEYRFFRDAAIRQALSTSSKKQNPWLYAVYSVIRSIALNSPDTFACTRSDFAEMVYQLRLEEMGITPEYLLSTGEQANFLTYTSRAVAPKIRLLGRLAAVASPEVSP